MFVISKPKVREEPFKEACRGLRIQFSSYMSELLVSSSEYVISSIL